MKAHRLVDAPIISPATDPPERDWEGADTVVEPSVRSVAYSHVNQLRDPAIYVEGEAVYLLYGVGGESGIGIARLEGFLSPGDGQGGVRTSEKDRGKKNGR